MSAKCRSSVRSLLSFACLLCSFGTLACYAQEKPAELKTLLKERRELLSEAAGAMIQEYMELRLSYQEVAETERASFKADLDYFDKSEDRIQAIEKHKKAAENIVRTSEALVAAGRALQFSVMQAKAYSLEVQIELVKEKQKAKSMK